MIEIHEEKRSVGPMVLAGVAALLVTTLIFGGYTLLRRRHAETSAALSTPAVVEAPKPPKALVLVDDAMLQGPNTTIGGTVKNTSNEKLQQLSVELELKRRKDGVAETRLVSLTPADLDPGQEGRYSLEVRAQDYGAARLAGVKVGASPLPYISAQGQKRPPERLESKTVTVGGRPSGKRGEFLNSPDNPARVP
ncbi:MAG TPA: hypothetical protein VLL54_04590 [Pyrinomonadaceae bacterium]|nr:hypothetical protein [Pyrinomonadaceae bacterium]